MLNLYRILCACEEHGFLWTIFNLINLTVLVQLRIQEYDSQLIANGTEVTAGLKKMCCIE